MTTTASLVAARERERAASRARVSALHGSGTLFAWASPASVPAPEPFSAQYSPVLFFVSTMDEIGSACVALGIGPEPGVCVSDWMTCVYCGEKSRTWIVATWGGKSCVCASCKGLYYQQFRKLSTVSAETVDAGDAALHVAAPRRDFEGALQ